MPACIALMIIPLGKVATSVTFTTTNAQNAADNLATCIADGVAAQITSTQLNTVTTDFTTELTRIAALTDATVQSALDLAYTNEQRVTALGSGGSGVTVGTLQTYIAGESYAKLLQNGFIMCCDALEEAAILAGATGFANFLSANGILVDQYFADVFNQFALSAASGAYLRRYGSATAPALIPATSVFPHSNVDSLNVFTTTSTTAGTLTAGTAALAALAAGGAAPGGGTLEAYAGGAIGGSAANYTITVTYTSIAGVAGQTGTFTIPKGSTINTVFTPGGTYSVASIQSVAITTGTANGAGDIIKFRLKPARSVTA